MSSTEMPGQGGYRPEEPVSVGPVFRWPPRPVALLRWLFGFPGYLWPFSAVFLGIAAIRWWLFTPEREQAKTFSPGWVAMLLIGNLLLLVAWISIWHVLLYVRKAQGTEYKYTRRWLATADPVFLFSDQLWDNVFWTVCSAVPILTAFQAVTLWLQANDLVSVVDWRAHAIYCALLILLIPLWLQVHFYAFHRLIHWPPLYRTVHYVHHKNVNIGPWSGLAMHPIEHGLLFSAVALFWIVPSHPLHADYLLLTYALSPALSHHGFDRIRLSPNRSFPIGDYMHYLHHKFLRVNYGGSLVPLDQWLGTFHDGSEEAARAMKARMRKEAKC